jgi:predicted nucleic acid-binding Zn ribbon protein
VPLYEFKCPKCGKVETFVYRSYENMMGSLHPCSEDMTEMERLPAAPAFVVHGFSARNGYAEKQVRR